jgi:hypothetical protein
MRSYSNNELIGVVVFYTAPLERLVEIIFMSDFVLLSPTGLSSFMP